jgi:hypothetical protein
MTSQRPAAVSKHSNSALASLARGRQQEPIHPPHTLGAPAEVTDTEAGTRTIELELASLRNHLGGDVHDPAPGGPASIPRPHLGEQPLADDRVQSIRADETVAPHLLAIGEGDADPLPSTW